MPASIIDWHGPRRQPCPACSRSDRDKTLGVTLNDDGTGVAHCFRCEYVETLRDDRPALKPAPTRQAAPGRREPAPVLSKDWRDFFARLEPLAGPALAYLRARCCVIPPVDGDLRWHPALRHPSGHTGPALVALVTDALTREPLTLHRTWVQADGTKAPVDPPRLLLGGHRKAGGVIRLWPDEVVGTGLAVAEGIETALSLAHAFRPVWACIDAGNLAALPVLAGVESLLIAADHDDAGIKAAEACAARWAAAGREASIALPERAKADINDLAVAA
ncbi:MAG: toprim domain-containing protein [Rubrivivax sp.]